jgi:hypothetical protein
MDGLGSKIGPLERCVGAADYLNLYQPPVSAYLIRRVPLTAQDAAPAMERVFG